MFEFIAFTIFLLMVLANLAVVFLWVGLEVLYFFLTGHFYHQESIQETYENHDL